MKLSSLLLDAERDWRFETSQRELLNAPTGTLSYYECPLCSYKKWIGTRLEGPNIVEVTTLPEGIECDLCSEVQGRAPEVFQWVMLMMSSLARDIRRASEDQR